MASRHRHFILTPSNQTKYHMVTINQFSVINNKHNKASLECHDIYWKSLELGNINKFQYNTQINDIQLEL